MMAIASALLCFAACSDNEEPTPPPVPKDDPEPKVEVSWEEKDITDHSIVFTITPTEAEICAYRVLPAGDKAPDAAAILASGTAVAADKATKVTVDELTAETAYKVYAAAANGDFFSSVAQKEFTTAPSTPEPPEPEVTTVELEWSQLAYYYSEQELDNTGNFYFILVLGEVDDHVGMPLEGPGNYVLAVDLYTELPQDILNPVLPDGTYTYSNVQKVKGTFFCSDVDGWSGPTVMWTGDDGTYAFTDGKVEISHTDAGYDFVGEFTTKAGKKIRAIYKGDIPFENKDIERTFNVNCTQAAGEWMGDMYRLGNSVWTLKMSDVALAEDGTPTAAGNVVELVMFNELYESFEQAVLAEGDYTVNKTFEVGSLLRGEAGSDGGYGSFITKWDGSRGENLYLYDGSMTLSKTGDQYSLTLDATTNLNLPVKVTYTGAIPLTSKVVAPDPGPTDYLSTLTTNVTIRQETIQDASLYEYGPQNDGKVNWFGLDLENYDGYIMSLSIMASPDAEGYLPSGTYTVLKDGAVTSYVPFSVEPGYEDGGAAGTYYESYATEEVGYVYSGTLEVVYDEGTGEYQLTWDFLDDSTKHKIQGSYSGPLELY